MTTHSLFARLCDVVNALQLECARLRFSPHKLALEAITERLDVLIDQVIDEGMHDPEDSPCP